MREAREILTRDKDFIKCILKPKLKYLGEKYQLVETETKQMTNKTKNI